MSADLLQHMRENDLDEFGAFIPDAVVHQVLDIVMPTVGTREDFKTADLQILEAISYVRRTLLNEGKYLRETLGGYQILLPSQNAEQVKKYLREADGKLKRGMKLLQNTPASVEVPSNLASRLMMKQEAIQNARIYGRI